MHKEEKVYVPELVFGNLLTGSNFDDTVAKVTGGRNGYGAKLCNIFSTSFQVETIDSKKGLKYTQVTRNASYLQMWSKNMSKAGAPVITPCEGASDTTTVTFSPDLGRFGLQSLTDTDILKLFERR